MSQFKKGETVVLTKYESWRGIHLEPGAMATYDRPHGCAPDCDLSYITTDEGEALVYNSSFEADVSEPATLDSSKVKAGDTVTVEVKPLHGPRYSLSGEVYRVGTSGPLWVGPICITAPDEDIVRVTLTAHRPAPEPEPEWKRRTVWVDARGTWYLAGTYNASPRLYADDGAFVRPPMDGLRPLVVIDPAAVDVDGLARTIRRTIGFGLLESQAKAAAHAALAELGIEATS